MGHLFMFLCELIITLEFLLSTKMVEFYCEPINNYQLNVRTVLNLYEKKQIYGVNQCKQVIAGMNHMFYTCDKIQFCPFITL